MLCDDGRQMVPLKIRARQGFGGYTIDNLFFEISKTGEVLHASHFPDDSLSARLLDRAHEYHKEHGEFLIETGRW
ncbi:hypothetical protein ES703_114210 [subsurface metagenome]